MEEFNKAQNEEQNKLQNKIDFTLIFEVKNANPNGDPLNGNRPRTNISNLGEVSDVCLKRKIRNRLQQMGEDIFVQSQDDAVDNAKSLNDRFGNFCKEQGIKDGKMTAEQLKEVQSKVNKQWIDVRSFGQVFAFKSLKNFSMGIRGAVSIQSAFSIDPVEIETIQITKSVNSDTTKDGKKSADTMGSKHRINYALYRTNGSINPHFAEKNSFTEDDALKIKQAIKTLFENDMSSARPEGSLKVVKLYWWTHGSPMGDVASVKLFDSVKINKKPDVEIAESINDYEIMCENNFGLEPEMVVDE